MKRVLQRAPITFWCMCAFALPLPLAPSQATGSPPGAVATDDAFAALVAQLSDDDYRTREQATSALVAMGQPVVPRVRAALETTPDPEARRRLRAVLERLSPPKFGVIVTAVGDESPVVVGDILTHINGQLIHNESEFSQSYENLQRRPLVKVFNALGYVEVRLSSPTDIDAVCTYKLPNGPEVLRAVRLYADGCAEQANEVLRRLNGRLEPGELEPALRALIAYAAGDGSKARQILREDPEVANPSLRGYGSNIWNAPSFLDLVGPHKAPYQLEWELLPLVRQRAARRAADPDLRVQRVLLPAHRYVEALTRAVELWRDEVTNDKAESETLASTIIAGNLLAVASWMLYDLDLQSECQELIEPRSVFLRQTPTETHKWVRFQTDAWLPYLAGDSARALAEFLPDARDILARPPRLGDEMSLTRRPDAAAIIAYFLYDSGDEKAIAEMRDVVGLDQHVGLPAYVQWMLFAVTPTNAEAVRRDLEHFGPSLPSAVAIQAARALAMLEYVSATPRAETFEFAANLAVSAECSETTRREVAAEIQTLALLADGQLTAAGETIAPLHAAAGGPMLQSTLEFRQTHEADLPATIAGRPLAAVPCSADRRAWIVLTADRRLVRYDVESHEAGELAAPTPTWFPGPVNWPWLGCEATSGRAWAYARRRVIEFADDGAPALRMNIAPDQIDDFARRIAPVFSSFASEVVEQVGDGEAGEYLRAHVRAHAEVVADPDLPELGCISPIDGAADWLHVAVRGGPHFLLNARTQQVCSARWIADQVGAAQPLTFFARGVGDADAPTLFLFTNQGLVRWTPDAAPTRIALPGDEPFPSIIPENMPYKRADARWVYFARLPEDGGQVLRLSVADNRIETLDIQNLAVPDDFWAVQSRAQIRRTIDARFSALGLPSLSEFVSSVRTRVMPSPSAE